MKSILIIGMGRFGRHMAQRFSIQGDEVLGIDGNEDQINSSLEFLEQAQIGDATSRSYMETLGVDSFDICVVAIGDNFESSLVTTHILAELGAKNIIARANSNTHAGFLLRNGADEVIYPEKDAALRAAMKHGSDKVYDYIEMSPEYAIYEIAVPSIWIGKSIIDLSIRNQYNINIIAIKENGTVMPMPQANHKFLKNQTVVFIGHHNDIEKLLKKC